MNEISITTLLTAFFTNQNVQSASEAEELNTIEEARLYMEECVARGDIVITLICGDELYEQIASDCESNPELPLLWDLIENAGILHATTQLKDDRRTITINVTQYYPGMLIARAYKSGDRSILTDRESAAMEACESLAAVCAAGDTLETCANIHDAICSRVTYSNDESDIEKDTAVGALLNYKADCDGYADAFYAVASIAGITVRYQCGATGNVTEDSGHMWNLVSIDRTWRAIDVTWDDESSQTVYIWFNAGIDRMSLRHRWNWETSVTIAETTNLTERPDSEFLINSEENLEDALDSVLGEHIEKFFLFFTEENEDLHECALDRAREKGFKGVISYYWDEKMRSLSIQMEDK